MTITRGSRAAERSRSDGASRERNRCREPTAPAPHRTATAMTPPPRLSFPVVDATSPQAAMRSAADFSAESAHAPVDDFRPDVDTDAAAAHRSLGRATSARAGAVRGSNVEASCRSAVVTPRWHPIQGSASMNSLRISHQYIEPAAMSVGSPCILPAF